MAETTYLDFSEAHLEELRGLAVSWDGLEVGAPCLEPGRRYSKDCLKLLQLVTLHADLAAGTYLYRKPRGENIEFSPLLEDWPEQTSFQFSDDHRALLKAVILEMNEIDFHEHEVPGIDPKRPYGAFTFYQAEMAMHLGRPLGKDENDVPILSQELEDEMTRMHQEMQAALQVFLQHCTLAPGRYRGDEHGNWEPVSL